MFRVREAHTPQETQAIIALRYEILRKPWDQPAATATDDLESASVNAFIADEAGQVIACGRLQENPGKTGQIRYMAVDKHYQGKGLGKQILGFLESRANEMGLAKIELQARDNALEFYKSAGYTIKEKSFLLWGLIQHYLMEKDLGRKGSF